MKKLSVIVLCSMLLILISSCTFDYGDSDKTERQTPDLVMQNVEYFRMRSSDPVAKFQAERAERYEKQGVMKLMNFSFEQYGERGTEVNAVGQAGFASVHIESGDVDMSDKVKLEVESEDIILETELLGWKDEPRILSSGNEEVTITQESGTSFTGVSLRVETRIRKWEFEGNASGTYIFTEEEEETEEGIARAELEPSEKEPTREQTALGPEDRDPVREPDRSSADRTPSRQRPESADKSVSEGKSEEEEKIDEASLK